MRHVTAVPKSSRGADAAELAEPKRSSRGVRRAAILAAGVEIFASTPYDEVSVDDIAERADVAHGLIFHYFKNKRGLYLAVLERTAEDLQRVHTPPDDTKTPGQLVRAVINAHVDYIERHPETLLAFLRGGVGSDPAARQIIEDTRWEGIQQVLDVLEIKREDPAVRMAMRGWAGFLDEATIYWLENETRVARERLIEVSVEVMVTALLKARGRLATSGVDPRVLLEH
jgi:AcrR family transcriptional regulator